MLTINYAIVNDNCFSDTAGLDVDASIRKLIELTAQAISEKYPDAKVTVTGWSSGMRCKAECFDDSENGPFDYHNQVVEDIAGNVWQRGEWYVDSPVNAQEFVNGLEFPVVFYAGVGCPGGQSIAILEGTELPFDLSEVDGTVTDGNFEATNLNDGSGAHGWRFSDHNSNTVYNIQCFSDESIWTAQNDEYNAAC